MISNTFCKLSGHVVRTCLTDSTQFFSNVASRTAQNKVSSFSVNNKTFVRIKTKYKTKMTDEWLQIGNYSVFPWSISGVETCVVIKTNGPTLTFDLGYSCRSSVSSNLVFFSHGHMDHISGIAQHAAKRSLYGMKPAKYYSPVHLVEPLTSLCKMYGSIAGNIPELEKMNIIPAPVGEVINLPSGLKIKPFPTTHRCPSQGYMMYQNVKNLKEEFVGKPSQEIAQLVKSGVQIHDEYDVPELAYTGDTTFDVFTNPPTEDLFRVKLLITEATYIDQEPGKDQIQKARDRGHMHLQEIADNADMFKNVENILLIHFSDKYSTKYIQETVKKTLPDSIVNKVHIATIAKEIYG